MKASLYPRHAEQNFLADLEVTPAVLMHGPRQCGKTTLAKMIGKLEATHTSILTCLRPARTRATIRTASRPACQNG